MTFLKKWLYSVNTLELRYAAVLDFQENQLQPHCSNG